MPALGLAEKEHGKRKLRAGLLTLGLTKSCVPTDNLYWKKMRDKENGWRKARSEFLIYCMVMSCVPTEDIYWKRMEDLIKKKEDGRRKMKAALRKKTRDNINKGHGKRKLKAGLLTLGLAKSCVPTDNLYWKKMRDKENGWRKARAEFLIYCLAMSCVPTEDLYWKRMEDLIKKKENVRRKMRAKKVRDLRNKKEEKENDEREQWGYVDLT